MNNEMAKKLLFEVQDILNRAGLKFWLLHGTCLGAWRDKRFIENDKDIDLGVKLEDLAPKMQILKKEFLANEFKITTHNQPYNYECFIRVHKYSEQASIFGHDLINEKRFCVIDVKRDYCRVIDAIIFENLKEIDFLGRKFLVPSETDKYLELEYGEGWRIRKPHPKFISQGTIVQGFWETHSKEIITKKGKNVD